MKKVCVVTTTRAEYGLLKPIITEIDTRHDLQLQLFVTGTHLEEKYGYTINEITSDNFKIDAKARIISGESKLGIIETMSSALYQSGQILNELKPDIIIMDGDRYELPPIALAATILNIPIAHIGGGDVTEGAYDDSFRHSLTKLSTLHFPSTEFYRKRIIQMGEEPERVFNVGSTGIENILKMKLLSKEDLEEQIGFKMFENTLLVTFHPVTNEINSQTNQFKELLKALDTLDNRIIFTRPNADTDRDILDDMLNSFTLNNKDRSIAFTSMGLLKYLSAMKYCLAVVGNSSSGIIEAPSLGVPTINIGNRQKGRIKANSVIDCTPEKDNIIKALKEIQRTEFKALVREAKNPYQGKNTAKEIIKIIERFLNTNRKLTKSFYDFNTINVR